MCKLHGTQGYPKGLEPDSTQDRFVWCELERTRIDQIGVQNRQEAAQIRVECKREKTHDRSLYGSNLTVHRIDQSPVQTRQDTG